MLGDDRLVRKRSKWHTKTACGDRRVGIMCKVVNKYKEMGLCRYKVFDDCHCQSWLHHT